MLKTWIAILLMLVIFFTGSQVAADMYKWVDQNGVTHYSDTPPLSVQKVKTIKTPNYPKPRQEPAPVNPQIYNRQHLKKPTLRKAPYKTKPKRNYASNVEIFTTSWCKYCKRAIKFLRTNNIKFKQYDIEKDPAAAKLMFALGGTGGVPFAIINGKKVPGFSTSIYKQALGLR